MIVLHGQVMYDCFFKCTAKNNMAADKHGVEPVMLWAISSFKQPGTLARNYITNPPNYSEIKMMIFDIRLIVHD